MNWPEDHEGQRAKAGIVIAWIVEALGEEAASTWAWECTPMPCWLPSDEQLDEGLRIASGELDLREHVTRCYAEMDEQMATYRATQSESVNSSESPNSSGQHKCVEQKEK